MWLIVPLLFILFGSGMLVGWGLKYSAHVKEINRYKEALIWCSAAAEFQPNGKARKGYEKVVLPLIGLQLSYSENESN